MACVLRRQRAGPGGARVRCVCSVRVGCAGAGENLHPRLWLLRPPRPQPSSMCTRRVKPGPAGPPASPQPRLLGSGLVRRPPAAGGEAVLVTELFASPRVGRLDSQLWKNRGVRREQGSPWAASEHITVWGRSQNLSTQGPFILLGFPGPRGLHVRLFLLFLVMYVLTVAGNLATVSLVGAHRHLRTPTYFFLCSLSFLEVRFTMACVPKTLAAFAWRSGAISSEGCAVQMYFIFSLGCTRYFPQAAMAYDRYLATCLPLRHGSIKTPGLSARLALGSWLCGFSDITVPAALTARLSSCGSRVIHRFFCDVTPWVVLPCSDTRAAELASFGIASGVILGTTLVSSARMVATVVRIPSAPGRRQASSTCSPHLTVVLLCYGSTPFLHVRASLGSSLDLTKAATVLDAIVTPVLSPFTYTLRNKDVEDALRRGVQGK
ncbi:olfactory receptor 287-like [Hippopotamus amphibius kiboko]|uniref:olfactory receptor 287-like n=1 Tax=Hippopotamus amphibius kiboko TaxID=575201 RepID=UPI00259A316D|nr:olfactory receptor 287-like [Hippopotamus amphibius kiboko]